MTMGERWGALLAIPGIVLACSSGARAQSCEPAAASVVSVQGNVDVSDSDRAHWRDVQLNQVLCAGQQVRLMPKSRAVLLLPNETLIHLDEGSVFTLRAIEPEKPAWLDLLRGALHMISRVPRALNIRTPLVNAGIEGTEFALRVDPARAELWVYEGRVRFSNRLGQLLIASGEAAAAVPGRAPERRIVVKPRQAVEWALYYPPLLDSRPEAYPEALRPAVLAYRRNDLTAAFAALDGVPEGARDARYYTLRAGLLLSVGRVPEAERDLTSAQRLDPKNGTAYALRAVIAVVRNEHEEALKLAAEAVRLAPGSATPYVARSYAEQSAFEIEKAHQSLQQASRLAPEDALVWARLSDINLSLGDLDAALAAARKAEQLDPGLSRTQSVLGFAYLTRIEVDRAKTAFERAMALDPADPLPRLGLGLAKIRDGDLDAGTKEIEIAASLDPNNSLVRSYLGKAYYEQKRSGLAETEYEQAKLLDPKDPTPWFYDAIQKQTVNRPVEALRDLETSIDLNDNRAVYRSRLLLDADRAARGTSHARVYNDLGFTQLGLNEAGESLAIDPSQDSAHRFLSDTYRGVRRRETSRVSELLQAQMLQDININPVQPSFSETNLNIITSGGAIEPGFNEFTPLFERDEVQLNATGVFGNHDTLGGEGVVSAVYDRFSLSAGAFHLDTDGWRDNHDIDHDIYNVFAQAAITPELNIQAEYRNRNSEFGDLEFDFFPGDFEPNSRNSIDQETARAGLRYSPAQHSTFLLSYIHGDRTEGQQNRVADSSAAAGADEDANQVESQYIFKHERFNVIAGFGYTRVETGINADFTFNVDPTVGGLSQLLLTTTLGLDDYRGYLYTNIKFPDAMTWTLGLSVADFAESGKLTTSSTVILPAFLNLPARRQEQTNPLQRDISEINPKVGLQWDVTRDLRLRAAYIEAVKQSLVANRTLEPTQVAGFNQFFDEANGSKSRRYGAGFDWQVTPELALGGEATWRDIDEPTLFPRVSSPVFVDDEADERLHQVYLYWTPLASLAVRTSFVYDAYQKESDELSVRLDAKEPLEVETISVPVSASYFHPSGFFAGASVTFVDQDVEKIPLDSAKNAILNQGRDHFAVVDAAIGFRLPKRWGIVSLQVLNLFDEGFNYQDDSFREFSNEPAVGPYFPVRTVLGRITINF